MSVSAVEKKVGLGTFSGVYLPSVLTIFGVIMYLRLGLVVGSVGLVSSITIILLATSITFLTSLSIATCATNMVIKGGGAYYLISRAFGKEVGAAIGLPLYTAQTIGIAFYIAGFVEAVGQVLPGVPPLYMGLGTLVVLTCLAYTSASLAIKAQGFIFVAIICSLVSFFMGKEVGMEVVEPMALPRLGFWAIFALFFPAVTGIEAGVSMSGDLRNPSKSLVKGVAAAVLTGLVIYLVMSWRLSQMAPRSVLCSDPFIVQHIARWGWVIVIGILGATLSSGLGALLGAPRTLQALAKDGVMPSFLSKGFGVNNEPRIATLFTFIASGLCVYLGKIDVIAPLLTMFFLMSYGMLNLAAGLEGFVQNPSWRPTFHIPSSISFVGFLLCIMAMFMINPGASFIAIFFVVVVYLIAMRSSLASGWDDIRQGILFLFSRIAVYRLAEGKVTARSWRPSFLVFTNGYYAPKSLLKFTSCITKGKGFLVIASIFSRSEKRIEPDRIKRRIREMCKLKKVEALVTVLQEEHPAEGMKRMVETCGLGALRPNTVVLGDTQDPETRQYMASLVLHAYRNKKNAIVIVGNTEEDFLESSLHNDEGGSHIDLWWDDESKENSKLMLVLAHMHQSSRGKMKICVKCTVSSETARQHRKEYFDDLFARSRFHVSTQVYVSEDEPDKLMQHFSQDANLVMCGLKVPTEGETPESYLAAYRDQLKSHRRLHNLVYVLAGEPVDLLPG